MDETQLITMILTMLQSYFGNDPTSWVFHIFELATQIIGVMSIIVVALNAIAKATVSTKDDVEIAKITTVLNKIISILGKVALTKTETVTKATPKKEEK